jgi:hypothetical protein
MSFLDIDKMQLDKEWLGQPALYFEYSQRLADARRDYDQASSALSVVAAEINAKIRKDPTAFDLPEKTTEASINAAVTVRPRYIAAQKVVQEKRHHMDIMQGAVTALEHRKRALTMLVSLHAQNYFSDPKITNSPELRRAVEDDAKFRARGRATRERE